MLPVVAGAPSTRRHILAYTAVLVPVSLAPVLVGLAGWTYGVGAAALGVLFVAYALRLWRETSETMARRTFAFSIIYLAGIFALLLLDRALPF